MKSHVATRRRSFSNETPIVIKLGGRSMEGPGAIQALAEEVSRLGRPAVVVHGGGSVVSDWCRRLGIEPSFHSGLRVTDSATLEVAVAVLAGLANKRIVAQFRAAGLDAVGLSGLDGGLLEVVPHPDAGTLGAVGIAKGADLSLLVTLLGSGRLPVVASIGAFEGDLLNVNADDAAAAIAAAVGAVCLVMFSDVEGVRIDGRPLISVELADLAPLLSHPDISGGMVPKLQAAGHAVAGGASVAVIGRWNGPGTLNAILAGAGNGTRIQDTEPAEVSELAWPLKS